jgi:multiple sugar transport system substrate-binding protein
MELLLGAAVVAAAVVAIELILNERTPASLVRSYARNAVRLAGLLVILFVVALGITAAVEVAKGPYVTVYSNEKGVPSEAAFQAMIDHCTAATGVQAVVHYPDFMRYQESIESLLRDSPVGDLFSWFPDDRMQALVDEGLVADVSDVWATVGDRYSAAFRAASTAADGRQYLVPTDVYPWVVVYRRSVFAEMGYTVPATYDELLALARRMAADGLVPFAFGDKHGFEAMGWFDILDMRLNGYQFHADLLAGRERWTDPRVEAVFARWKELLPFFQPGYLDRTGWEASEAMLEKRAGMIFYATYAGEPARNQGVWDDLDIFPFPPFGNEWDAERAIDAPIDGIMLRRSAGNPALARTLLECLSTPAAQLDWVRGDPVFLPAASGADLSVLSPYQRRIAEVIGQANRVARFFDNDTTPDFSGPEGMQRFFREFLADPGQDLATLTARIQAFRDALP